MDDTQTMQNPHEALDTKVPADVGVRRVSERIWLDTFMYYDLGYFCGETCRLEPIANPFEPIVSPMSSE